MTPSSVYHTSFPGVDCFHFMDNPVACYAADPWDNDSSCSSLRDSTVRALHHYKKTNKTRPKSDPNATSLKHLQLHETSQVVAIHFTATMWTSHHSNYQKQIPCRFKANCVRQPY